MCLSEDNAEILVEAGEYLDRSLHDKTVSYINLIAKSMPYGRISHFGRVSLSEWNMNTLCGNLSYRGRMTKLSNSTDN